MEPTTRTLSALGPLQFPKQQQPLSINDLMLLPQFDAREKFFASDPIVTLRGQYSSGSRAHLAPAE
ncbi:uncharacterized protein RHO25_012297 [Cercospora beticola]|uniref:Uncharacterized protein n=1 Tax=Cercospora beticola TaxID=122368 RepID=A0ABZ0P7F9_CERBT|nr:hypothetical protein RHO25_012297 [Cercospora beticola]